MTRRFCVFILTHGRPDTVLTLRSLQKSGYTGDWFIVIDNEDSTADRYIANFGRERVIVFDKRAVGETFDTADLSDDYRSVVFARNVAFDLARERGYTHFVEMDDDYDSIRYRYEKGSILGYLPVPGIMPILDAMFDFFDDTGAAAVAFGQSGDLLGGVNGYEWRQRRVKRKVMNAIFCRTVDTWRFLGRVNEDVNTYTTLATRGHVFLSTMDVTLNQQQSQSQTGGMTDLYRDSGTYQKSMYPVMMCPSAVRIDAMASEQPRIHHRVSWNNVAPKIIAETYRKAVA